MAQVKFDVVIEAAHYDENGQLEWVRAYQKRGPAFSDITILDRTALITLLKAGKQIYTGKRIQYMGSSFAVSQLVRIIEKDGKEVVVSGNQPHDIDCLEDAPII